MTEVVILYTLARAHDAVSYAHCLAIMQVIPGPFSYARVAVVLELGHFIREQIIFVDEGRSATVCLELCFAALVLSEGLLMPAASNEYVGVIHSEIRTPIYPLNTHRR